MRPAIVKNTVLSIAFLIPIAVLVWWPGLNYLGYCRSESHFLSDEEAIDLAIANTLALYPPVIELHEAEHGKKEVVFWEPQNVIPYQSIEEFKAVNKDCCNITMVATEGYTPPFTYRLAGSISRLVHIKYLVRYRDDSGRAVARALETYPAVSNCGRVWSGI